MMIFKYAIMLFHLKTHMSELLSRTQYSTIGRYLCLEWGGHFWAVIKTLKQLRGVPEFHSVLAVSKDGSENSFSPATSFHAYGLNIFFKDINKTIHYERVEFPFVYVEKNRAAAISNAVWTVPYASGGIRFIREISKGSAGNDNQKAD